MLELCPDVHGFRSLWIIQLYAKPSADCIVLGRVHSLDSQQSVNRRSTWLKYKGEPREAALPAEQSSTHSLGLCTLFSASPPNVRQEGLPIFGLYNSPQQHVLQRRGKDVCHLSPRHSALPTLLGRSYLKLAPPTQNPAFSPKQKTGWDGKKQRISTSRNRVTGRGELLLSCPFL